MSTRASSLKLSLPQPATRDWTTGPAKHVAALILGAASVAGLSYGILAGRSPAVLARSGPRVEAATTAALAGSEPAPGSRGAASGSGQVANLININTASAVELQLLPGIGPALAARILDDRAKNGPYATVDDLDRVRGIGPRTIERLRALACTQ